MVFHIKTPAFCKFFWGGITVGDIFCLKPFVELFTIRHDAETGIWFETGSWKEVRQKVAAITTCQVNRHDITLYQIKGDKWIYKECHLKEQYRKIKLCGLEPEYIIQKTVN